MKYVGYNYYATDFFFVNYSLLHASDTKADFVAVEINYRVPSLLGELPQKYLQ